MKQLSKIAAIFPFALLLALVLVLSAAAVPSGAAHAEETSFDVVYPDDGYFPVSDAGCVAANGSYLAVYDAAAHAVFATALSGGTGAYFPFSADEEAAGLWLSGATLLVEARRGTATVYYAADLTAGGDLTEIPLDEPADISYIVADDYYFYAKSDTAVALYSNELEGGSLALEKLIDDRYVQGKYIFAANERVLYFYAQNYSNSEYFVYDTDDERATTIMPDTGFIPAAVSYSDGGLVAARRGETIRVLSVSDGTGLVLDTGITFGDDTQFASYGNKLYVANGGVDVYTLDFAGGSVTLSGSLSMSGSAEGMFDSPSDIVFTPAGTVVADTGNSRVAIYGGNGVRYAALDEAPVALAADSSGIVFAASSRTVYQLMSDGTSISAGEYCSVPEGETILDIAHTGTSLVILTGTALYSCSAFTGIPQQAMPVSDGIAVAAARNNVLYAMTSSGIYTLSSSSYSLEELVPFRSYDLTGASDLAVDYRGSIFVSFTADNRIVALDNSSPASLSESASFELSHSYYTAAPSGIALDGSRAFFTSEACFVGAAEVGAVDEDTYVPTPDPDTDGAESLSFATVARDAFLFDEPSRFDTMTAVGTGTVVLCYDGISEWEGYRYVYFDGKTGYIDASALSAVSPTEIGVRYTLAAGAPVLAHPASDEPVTFAEEMLVTVTDDAALLDGGAWRRISYEGKQYFVSANDLTLYVEPEPEIPEPERTFGRASADRPGGLINLYVAPDRSSAVLAEVVDGTRMEIVGESGDFWLVGFEGGIGYAAKSEIELEGLTTVQIVSIVLCCAVLVTGGVVFVVIWQTRKKEKEKE